MQSSLPQGVFDKRFSDHVFLEYELTGDNSLASVREALKTVNEQTGENLFVTMAFGPKVSQQLDSAPELPRYGDATNLLDTQADVWVWLQGKDRGTTFDAARKTNQLLGEKVMLVREVVGFVYHDSRDLTGFVDGIGNPDGEKALDAAIIPEGEPGAGGSVVLTQQWRHDLAAFHQLPQKEQEDVIGHTKPDAQEYDDDVMPANAHVGRVDVSKDGVVQRLWRRSVPYGDSQEHGLYFLSFACEWERYAFLLKRMFGATEDGITDRLTEFTQLVSGAWWFCPSQAQLNQWLEG